ncbi:MAG: DNA cytosine methyltransferase [Oscillospiraceae bacterium]|nr:DNA cytosine methyltransferase [Oscillospiraceae bacterium]
MLVSPNRLVPKRVIRNSVKNVRRHQDSKNHHEECNNKPLRVLSLFSGCGGLDIGFEGDFDIHEKMINKKINPDWYSNNTINDDWIRLPKTRFRTVFANDIRPDAKTAWLKYFSKHGIEPSIYQLESIVDLVKAHKQGDNVFPDNIDVVTGGFPCQDFSVAGKRMGLSSNKCHKGTNIEPDVPNVENRGQLYMWMREVIAITQPRVFIAENVKGLANLADVKKIIENDFRSVGENGYLVINARVIHAADYGVPQSRERVVFIGFNRRALREEALLELSAENINNSFDPYPPRTHSFTKSGKDLISPTNLAYAFRDLSEPSESQDLSQQKYSKAKFMGKHCQGQTEVNINSIGPTIRSEHHGNIEFRRLSAENGGKNTDELNQGLPERRLTIRECARIQTFPDDYEFIIPANGKGKGVSASAAYKIIGNAVPPLLGYHIAKRLENNWNLYFGVEKNDNIG